MTGLMISGGYEVGTEELANISTPCGTRTHRPIPHNRLLELVRQNLSGLGYHVTDEQHGVSHEGARYFGLLELRNGANHDDYSLIAGIRNSHDKRFPAGLAVGSRVFVCSNLAFSAEVVIARKHTRNILLDLPGLVQRALGKLGDLRQKQDERISAYKACELSDAQAHDLIVRGMRGGVVASSKVGKVADEWYSPWHEEFRPRTAWSLMNAHTEVLKDYELHDLPRRTGKLHGLFDLACGLISRN